MAEYIKREDIERALGNGSCRLEDLPSIDIVTCKDCEYYERTQYGAFCNNVFGLYEDTDGDDYCSYAEREEDNDGQGKGEKV